MTDAEAAAVGTEGERCDENFTCESGSGQSGDAPSGGRLDKLLSEAPFKARSNSTFDAPFEARCEALRETRFDARSEALKALRQVACGAAAKAVSLSPDRGGLFGLARAGGRNPRR